MATLTIEIPDELMEQLEPLQTQLPELLRQCVERSTPAAQVYQYVLDFLLSQPTPHQISEFRPTPEMRARLQILLDRNQQGKLTAVEQQELDDYEQIEHLLIMLKAGNLASLIRQVAV